MEGLMNNSMERRYMPGGAIFYTIEDVMKLTGWGEKTIQKLFNDPNFPAADYGNGWRIEAEALKKFFSVRHVKKHERHWNGKGKVNVKARK